MNEDNESEGLGDSKSQKERFKNMRDDRSGHRGYCDLQCWQMCYCASESLSQMIQWHFPCTTECNQRVAHNTDFWRQDGSVNEDTGR